ncbi:MAG: right-handed parallel beta-helix repeat-containing protein, partial [Planctomycetes bacterium]|nr:right-handed parallel beta-helix repeat-containing protein [Planctomycetota bacterium]
AVQFTDTSTGSPSSWAWTFGDGSTSAAQNPSHSYDTLGSYGVALTISNGSDSASIDKIITVASGEVSGKVYWVSPTGTASWAAALSTTPLAGTACCSLATANANITAGDTVYLRAGIYNTHICPASSGTSESRISYRGYTGETPIIRNTTLGGQYYYYHGILLEGRSYITVDGINVDNPTDSIPVDFGRPLSIIKGACYNEIKNCDIDGNYSGSIQWWSGDVAPVTNNWMHGCTIHHISHLYWAGSYVAEGMGMQVGVPSDYSSNNNTIEDNVFYACGHHLIEIYSRYNVLKNNYFHNEGWAPNNTGYATLYGPDSVPLAASANLWGHRDISIDNNSPFACQYLLMEGNRVGHSGPAPENDGGDGMALASTGNIIRYNDFFNCQNNGVLFKTQTNVYEYADNNRFFNNTFYKNGRWENTGPQWQGYNFRWYGSYKRTGNVIINNLLNTHGGTYDMCPDPGNPGANRTENNWLTANGNPLFVDTDVSDPTSTTRPDLRLQSGSPCIDRGTHLTQANGTGSNSTTLIVDDALFFQDGTWGSSLTHGVTLFPDWIAIGSVTNIVKISSIDYMTNTITLASPMIWNDNAKIWLYSDSRGKRVLYGAGPDAGAHEYLF